MSQDTAARSLCKVATSQPIESTFLFLCADTYLSHIPSSRRYTKADPRCASSLHGSNAEHMTNRVSRPTVCAKTSNTSSPNTQHSSCISKPHVLRECGYPLLHKSSSEEHNKHFAILKQDSRTHLLSLSSNPHIHTCGISSFLIPAKHVAHFWVTRFCTSPDCKMRNFFAMLESGTCQQDCRAYVLRQKNNLSKTLHAPFLP